MIIIKELINILTVRFDKPDEKEIVMYPGKEFDYIYENDWFTDPVVQSFITNVEKVEYVVDDLFKSPITGHFNAIYLSGGTKTLILLYKEIFKDKYYKLSNLGDNCYSELAKFQDKANLKFWSNCIPRIDGNGVVFISEEKGEVLDSNEKFIQARIRSGAYFSKD